MAFVPLEQEQTGFVPLDKESGYSFADALKRGLSSIMNNPAVVDAAVMTASADPALLLANDKNGEITELRSDPLKVSAREQARGLAEYNALPENPIQANVGKAFEDAGGGASGFVAGAVEAAKSPVLAAKYLTEMLPGGALGGGLGGALAKAATARIAAPILKNMAVGSGFNAGATFGGGITPNTADAFRETGNLEAAKAQGLKQTAGETAVAALMGTPLNVGANSLRNIALKALLLSPADEALQTKVGNSAIGKETTDTDLAVSAILGAISAPGDIAGAAMFREKNAAPEQGVDYDKVIESLQRADQVAAANREHGFHPLQEEMIVAHDLLDEQIQEEVAPIDEAGVRAPKQSLTTLRGLDGTENQDKSAGVAGADGGRRSSDGAAGIAVGDVRNDGVAVPDKTTIAGQPVSGIEQSGVVPNGNVGNAALTPAPTQAPTKKPRKKQRTNTLLTAIRDMGGLSLSSKSDVVRDKFAPGGYNQIFRKDSTSTIEGLVGKGELDDYLPYELRFSTNDNPNGEVADMQEAAEWIKEKIASGEKVIPYEAQLELDQKAAQAEYEGNPTAYIADNYEDFSNEELEREIEAINAELRLAAYDEGENAQAARLFNAKDTTGGTDGGQGTEAGAGGSAAGQTEVNTGAEPLRLSGYTNQDILNRESEHAKAKAAEEKAVAEAARKAKEASDKAEVKRRSEGAAADFQLGGDAMQNLSGQGDVFGAEMTAFEKGRADTGTTTDTASTEGRGDTARSSVSPRINLPQEESKSKQSAIDAVKESDLSPAEKLQTIAAVNTGALSPQDVQDVVGEKQETLEDFGEKLGGARKDLAAAVKREYSDDELASLPLSKIWPADLAEKIEDKFVAAFAFAARQEIPNKPRKGYKVRAWVDKVKTLRELTSLMTDTATKEKAEALLKATKALEGFNAKVALLQAIDREQWRRIGRVSEYPNAYSYDAEGKQIPSPSVQVEIDDKRVRFSGAKAMADVIELVNDKLGVEAAAKKMKFEVRGRGDVWFINKEGDPLYRRLKTFTTSKEALDYRNSNYDDLVAAWEAVKDSDNVKETDLRSRANRERSAEDWRKGLDVTPEQFSSEFGFRGVEFGNWVAQGKNSKERQGMLNAVYDAMMDLANIINVPPKALSLNGTLGLGFGSRGHGWASAHFEPDTLVINLTKTRGAGTLAHEWFHALDNYFQLQRGKLQSWKREDGYITYNPENYYVHKQTGTKLPERAFERMIAGERDERYGRLYAGVRDRSQWELKTGVRPEVSVAFADLVEALNKSPMAKRASLIDKSGGGYWSRIIERAARSFENYVIHKMMQNGYHNDYLANVTPVEEFQRDAGRYPYLLDNEIQPVAEAFDDLFATLQTKETDKGVALYSKGYAGGGQTVETVTKATARLRNGWAGFRKVSIVQSVKEIPNDLYLRSLRAGNSINQTTEGIYDPNTNTVYLIAENIASPERAVWVAVHEVVGHGGIRMLGKSVAEHVDRLSKNGTIEKLAQAIAKDRGDAFDKSTHAQEAIAELAAAHVTGDAAAIFDRYGVKVPAAMRDGILGAIARIVEAVRSFMAKVLGKQADEVSDSEVRDLLIQMNEAVNGAKREEFSSQNEVAMASMSQRSIPLQGGQIGNNASWNAPESTKLDNFIYTVQNKHIDMKRAIEAINASGTQLADKWDAYLSEELFHGRAAKRTQDFLNTELKPLLISMAKSGINIDELDQYLHARHAKEANALIAQRDPSMPDGGSGMTNKQSDDYFSSLSAEKNARLQAAARQVDSIISKTRDLYVSYGLVSKNQADEWARMFKHYVPLMREDHDGGMGIGQGFSIKGKEVKHRTGSTAAVVDIFANIALQREKAITRGEKNRVAVSLAGLAKINPNPEFWTFDKVPTERVLNENTGLVEERVNPTFKSRPNVVVAKIKDSKGDIQERAVVFNEHNERAARMAEAIKNLDATQLGELLSTSAKITRYFASINTQYNPVFGVTNLVRDTQGLLLNLSSTPIAGHRMAVLKNVPSALAGIYADMRAERKGHPATSQWAQMWEELQNEGGMTGYRDLYRTSSERADSIRHELNPYAWHDNMLGKIFTAGGALKVPLQIAQNKAGWLFDWLSDYNQTMEGATRLAAYKVAIEQGMSKPRAASLAKNITVNFNRKGQVGQQAGALYAFFNASMQGTARIGETVFKMDGGDIKTLRLSSAGKAIIYGGITLGAMQALALSFAGFDDDEPPEFVRERNVIIPIGGKKYITIPMPLGFHAIPNIGRIATEFALSGFKDPGKRTIDMIAVVANAFNPIGSSGFSMQTIAPTSLDPLAALAENKDWTGKSIYKEDRSQLSPTPGFTRNKDTATYLSKTIAEGFNSLTGGDKYEQGMFSPTADQLDYLIGQVTGGVGREASKAWQTGLAATTGEDLPTYKIPLAGRFYGDAGDQSSQGGRFYENLKRINVIEAGLKGRIKDGVATSEFKADNPDYLLIARANAAEKIIQALNRRKRAFIEADAPREKIKVVEDRITAEMKKFNDDVKTVRERRARSTQTQP